MLGNVLRYTSILHPDYDQEVPKDVTLNWTNVDTPPTIAPFNRDVSLTVNLEEDASPLEFFQLLFDKDYWEKIVTQTNNNAAARINNEARPMSPQSRLQNWSPVSIDEMKLLFCPLYFDGLCVQGINRRLLDHCH